MNKTVTILFSVFSMCLISFAKGDSNDLKIKISKSSITINGKVIRIDHIDEDKNQFEGSTEIQPFPNPTDDARFMLKNFRISFSQRNRIYNSVYILLDDSRFDDIEIEHEMFKFSNQTSTQQLEKILNDAGIKYSKYESKYELDPKGSCRIDSSCSDHSIIQASFKEFKLSSIEIRLKKVPPPDPVPDKFLNKKEMRCSSFSEGDELLTYTTELAKIEIRKADLIKLLNEELVENPSKDNSIRSQLKELEDCPNLEKLDYPLLYYTRNAMSELMKEGKCRVYDRTGKKYVDSFVVADWDGYTAGGVGFLLKNSKEAFFKNLGWIT